MDTYYDSAEAAPVTWRRAMVELDKHGIDPTIDECNEIRALGTFHDIGNDHDAEAWTIDAQRLLGWLGY